MAASDTVEVWTSSAADGVHLWQYNHGSSNAQIRRVELEELEGLRYRFHLPSSPTGTTIVCNLSHEIWSQYNLSEEDIEHALEKYTKLLLIPINLNGKRINPELPGWSDPSRATESDWREAIMAMGSEEPLFIMPLYSPPDELDAQGVLWIPPSG